MIHENTERNLGFTNRYLGYMGKIATIAFVHLMKGLMDKSINPIFAKYPTSLVPKSLDYMGIDCYMSQNLNDNNRWSVFTGEGAEYQDNVRKITWHDWHLHASSLVHENFKKRSALYYIRQGLPTNTSRNITKDENYLVPAHHVGLFLGWEGQFYDFFLDDRPIHTFNRHVEDFIQSKGEEFDPYFDLTERDYIERPIFQYGLPRTVDLTHFLHREKVTY